MAMVGHPSRGRPTCGGRSPTRAAAGHDLGTPSHASLGRWRRGAGDAHDAPLPSRTNPLHGTFHAFTTRLASFTCLRCNKTSDQFIHIEVCLLILFWTCFVPSPQCITCVERVQLVEIVGTSTLVDTISSSTATNMTSSNLYFVIHYIFCYFNYLAAFAVDILVCSLP